MRAVSDSVKTVLIGRAAFTHGSRVHSSSLPSYRATDNEDPNSPRHAAMYAESSVDRERVKHCSGVSRARSPRAVPSVTMARAAALLLARLPAQRGASHSDDFARAFTGRPHGVLPCDRARALPSSAAHAHVERASLERTGSSLERVEVGDGLVGAVGALPRVHTRTADVRSAAAVAGSHQSRSVTRKQSCRGSSSACRAYAEGNQPLRGRAVEERGVVGHRREHLPYMEVGPRAGEKHGERHVAARGDEQGWGSRAGGSLELHGQGVMSREGWWVQGWWRPTGRMYRRAGAARGGGRGGAGLRGGDGGRGGHEQARRAQHRLRGEAEGAPVCGMRDFRSTPDLWKQSTAAAGQAASQPATETSRDRAAV